MSEDWIDVKFYKHPSDSHVWVLLPDILRRVPISKSTTVKSVKWSKEQNRISIEAVVVTKVTEIELMVSLA